LIEPSLRLFLLFFRRGCSGWRSRAAQQALRYHGVADESMPFRTTAEVIGRRLDVPVVGIAARATPKPYSFLALSFSPTIRHRAN